MDNSLILLINNSTLKVLFIIIDNFDSIQMRSIVIHNFRSNKTNITKPDWFGLSNARTE